MRVNKKSNLQYWFTVEGDTEKWYLEHVQRVLNSSDETKKTIRIESKVCKSPKSFVKNTTALITPEITHLCDIESNSPEHLKNFSNILSEMAFAKKQKKIKYELGYSNYTFDLWIILHKQQLKSSLSDRSQYLNYINPEIFIASKIMILSQAIQRQPSKTTLSQASMVFFRSKRTHYPCGVQGAWF